MTTTPRARRTPVLRPLARRVHFLAGMFVAPFLVLACLTGLLYVISPQIHEDLYEGQLTAERATWPVRPIDEQVAAALAGHPEASLDSVVRPEANGRATWVNLVTPGQAPGEMRTVFVDPYTNYINGELTTIGGRLPANAWLRHFHSDLHLGPVGSLYTALAANWLVVIVAAGLVLWFAKQGRRPRKAKDLLAPSVRKGPPAARLRALHGGMGLYLVLGLLAVGLTGTLMSGYTTPLFDTSPPRLVTTPSAAAVDGAPVVSLDTALDAGREAGLQGLLEVRPSTDPREPIRVSEKAEGLPVHRGVVAVDPSSGQLLGQVTWADYPLGAKVAWLAGQFHTGQLFGLANQILLAVLVVGLLAIILTGYRIWWRRSPYGNPLTSAPKPVWRELGVKRLALVAAVAIVLGLVAPVLGASLVGFLVLDVVFRAVAARRAQAAAKRAEAAEPPLVTAP
ncbi:PepSY-associated TM helix domain-containing protein [Pseudonocardia pini]|uniref:PepSY-associated TM helix domain-containing protein n=1 Tax=Pseudonocardia pini TaxID=2758030 RepID=UPI0015F0084D|nr:PepSY domain-containing protein [Pseudonocardia pini]